MVQSINEPGTPAFEEIAGAEKPEITALQPDYCALGDADFDLHVVGTGFSAQSEIWFAGHPEPTTFNEDGSLSTGIKPSLWGSPVIVQCLVHTGTQISNSKEFTFAAEADLEIDDDGTRSRKWQRQQSRK